MVVQFRIQLGEQADAQPTLGLGIVERLSALPAVPQVRDCWADLCKRLSSLGRQGLRYGTNAQARKTDSRLLQRLDPHLVIHLFGEMEGGIGGWNTAVDRALQ
jgi:hypothetical protein